MSVSSPPPPPTTNSDSDSGPGTVPASSPTSNNDHDLSLRTSTSANSFQPRSSRRTHGSATPRSPSTSSYTSTTSAGTTKSRRTRSLRPPTWRAGSVRVKDASASVTTSFETSSKAKGGVVTSASEPSVSLINAESFPSFEDLVGDDDMSSSTLTARPGLRERRGRMDSSASVASLSMYINSSPNRTGTGNVEGKGKVTYGQGAGRRIFEREGAGTITREGEGRRRLMGLFNDLEERYTEPPEPMASANSSDSSNSNDSAVSDTPTVTLASVGDAGVNIAQDNDHVATGTVPDNDSQNASSSNIPHDHDSTATTMTTTADATPTITTTTTINTTNTVPEPKSYVPNFSINQPNTNADTSAFPNPMTDSPINNDDTQGDNSNANIALNPSEISISDSVGVVDASKETQDVTRTRVDSCPPTSASTSVPGSASASASWFGSLGKMMGRRVVDVQPPPVPSMVNTSEAGREEGKKDEETVTDGLDRTPKLGSGVASTDAAADSSTSAHEEATITVKPVENESLNLEASISDQTIREKTPSRDSKTAPTAASSKKSWFFTSTTSPTPPETVTEAATVTAAASASATDALVASTSGARPSSRHSRTSSRDSPPHSASTAASSFPSSPLTSSSFPSSIDDVPRLVLNETVTSQEGEGTIRPHHGPGQGPVVQRLRVVSMHKQMGLEEQARVGTLGLGLVPVVSSIGGEAGSSGEGEALNDTDTTNEDAASLKSKNTVTSGTTAGTSPRQPRKRIDSLNSLNPSTSRFSIVGVPLSFWSAPSPGPGPVKNGGMDKSKSHADSNATTSNASSSATPSVPQSTTAGAEGSSASAPATASNANTSTNMTGSGSINATTTSAASNISFNTGSNTTSNSTSNSNSKSVTPVPNSLSSKSGPVTALSTDVVSADVDVTADALDARGELVRVRSVTEATEGSGPQEEGNGDGEVKMVTNSDEATQDPVSVVASTSQAITTMGPTSAATYTGSWWDYVSWGSSTATAAAATGASSSSAGAAEGAKEPSSSDQAEAQAPSSTESSVETNTSTAASESTMALAQAVPPQTAPPPSQLVQPDPDSSSLPSATEPEIEIKSAPPTVPDTKPPRAASVFSGETIRSGAASWLAPWTWYSGSTPVSGSAGPSSVAAASSSATSVDRGSRLKRQMTESEKVKEEALARDREREQESKAESEAEAGAEKSAHQSQSTGATETKAGSSEQGQQQQVEQPSPSDSQSGNNAGSAPGESGVEALAGSGSGSSVPAATTADEPATANAVTTLTTTSPSRNDAGSGSGSGWTSFFSLTGKGKSPADRHADDGKGANVNGNENEGVDDEVRRDENGMEVMDLDSDEEGFGGQTQTPAGTGTGTGTDAQPGVGVNEASKDVATIDAARGKELVKKEKETMREILKAGATSPERKVSLVKALLLQPSSPKPASILSSSSPVKAISPPPESPTKAASTRSAGPSTNGKDQTEFKARGRTDSILTTATTTSNASEMAKRAPLLVVSDDIKAKAAAKAAKSAAKEKEKEREKEKGMAATAGPEVSDGKKAVEKKSSKDPVKEKEKKKEKEEKRSKSKSGSGSSTPAPPSAPPNLVLPTWSDTFYTAPRSHLPSGVLPTNPLPGTEAYEAMVQMQGKNSEHKGLGTFGKTVKYVSGVLFSGDRGSGGSSTSGNGERKRSSLFGGSTAPGSSTGARFSDALAGRRGSSGSTSSIPVNTEGKSGPISPRIAALRAGSSSGRGKGGSVKMGSTELEKLKEKEAEIEAERRREKEKLYWDWGRGLPRAWEVVEYGQPVGLMESEMKDEEDAKEKLEKEQDKSSLPQNAKEALSSQTAIPGMGLEPATTLSLPADMLTAYKGKGKHKANAEVNEAVQDVLKGCKKVVVIGIHGWFPGAVIKSVLGEPTGTSTKFVNMMVQALEDFQDRHEVRLDKVTKIPLEGEGTIDRRVEKLYTNLLSNQEWMDDLHAADAIFVATHSQGSVVSTHLLDRLIRERHIRTRKNGTTEAVTEIGVNMIPLPPQRVCCLALCGIHLGPLRYLSTSSLLQPYIQYFESAAARELFEFQNTENDVSKAYVRALRNVVDNGTKMVYVASLNDQVVPIYSGLFTSVSHPLILRALYIDGDAYHSSDFLSNLLVLLLRVLNCGLSDSGLLAHLSEVTAGSLNGVGHSTAYEELATFSLAVNYLFLTNDGFEEHPELTLEPFNASAEMNDYEIPWALRDLIADERVAHFFSQEITNLRDAFRDWNPKTSILRDIKRKLQPIQRLPSTIAPGSANSTSKL